MDKRKLRIWILSGVLTNFIVVGLLCLQIFPFQILEIKKIEREKNQAEDFHQEWSRTPEKVCQMEEDVAALEEELTRLPFIHRVDPISLLLKGLDDAGRACAGLKVEDILPLPPIFEGGVSRLSWRVTVRAHYPHLKEFFASLETLPFLISGRDFNIVVKDDDNSQTQFTIFTFLK